tara:strand:+ start:1242 stop:1871 length:630 start_codon:yes stop_codon:yes gene_type:complete
MSKYEWERGTIKIPSTEWKSFKTKILTIANKIIERDYNLARKLYERIMKEGEDIRAFNYKNALRIAMQQENTHYDSSWRIEKSMFPFQAERRKPLKPKKKNFKSATNRTESLKLNGEATISFDNTMKTVTWNVPENNHAVEEAHEHLLGKALFTALGSVTWKRNSGGVLIGNNEYNKGDSMEGEGANYITAAYGPLGAKRLKGMRIYER